MSTGVSGGADGPASPPRGQTSASVTRSQSTRSRPSTSTGSAAPHRAASTSHHSGSNRPTTSARPVQDILPDRDHETTNLPQSQFRKRSSNKDPAPPVSRGESSSRPHRRGSQKAPAAEMAPTVVNSTGPAPAPHDPRAAVAARSSRSRTTIPTQSGKWILGKTIGAGSMGKVKLAKKEESNEQVACKIIPRISPDDGHHTRAERERADQSKEIRTAREAAIVTLLNHPYICGLRDVVRTNYHWYMLFEYVNGGQMLDYIISHGKLKEKQARKFSRQIASALDYCHRNSIVHRDLKIENILISKTGDIKIIDFGLSNLFSPRSTLKTFCGSLYFAAPELLQARAYTGPEVDVWSFGIVLYVLVCGKVPFDDQSMPALHAKIKKGLVDYPNWLSTECKHLLSRMLVTDPKLRANMHEVMTHPWMNKGYNTPPDNFLPPREALTLPLDQEVITAMTGFNFGPPEGIKNQLARIIESEDYQRAVRNLQREKETIQPPKDVEKKRGFGFDFYKRRNSMNSRDTLTTPSSEGLAMGSDPTNAYSPLISIYYLVREKQERDRAEMAAQLPPPPKEKEAVPDIAPPQAAHTNTAAYEMPGEKATGGRSRPRARTHGEDDAPEQVKASQLSPGSAQKPEPPAEQPAKKESAAAGIFRRLSRRERKEPPPEKLEKDRSHPPIVHVHSPADAPSTLRKSFSIRRTRRDREDPSRLRSGSSQPQHSDLLSPPMSAGANTQGFKKGLGRSTSVSSAEFTRRRDNNVIAAREAKEPPPTSGSDQSTTNEKRSFDQRKGPAPLNSKTVAYRAKSLGHARRESIQARRLRREQDASREANVPVPEETDAEVGDQSGLSTDRLEDPELAKPVFLKGLFSVSTTSTRPVPEMRADIKRVLKLLGVEYTEIRGGFSCRHAPSIDLNKVASDQAQSPGAVPPLPTPGHRRRFSFGGLRGANSDRERDDSDNNNSKMPTTPRTPGGNGKAGMMRRVDDSDSRSDLSEADPPMKEASHDKKKTLPAGETSTHVQSDMGGSMVLEFEIFIVKVPVISLHGIQFKRLDGNTWQYKNMADQILKELRL